MHQATGQDGAPLRLTLGLGGLAIVALATAAALIELRGSQGVLASVLAGLAFAIAIVAGAVAGWVLAREPPRTRAGRWALGLAIVLALSFPLLGLITAALDLELGWAEPVAGLQLAAAIGAVALGAVAREPQRRGLLLIPLVIGTSALMFVLTDLLFPY